MRPSFGPPGHSTLIVVADPRRGPLEHQYQFPLGWSGVTMGPEIRPGLQGNHHALNRLIVGLVDQVVGPTAGRFLSLFAEVFE